MDTLTSLKTLTIDSLDVAKMHVDKLNGENMQEELITFDNDFLHIFWGGIGSMVFYVIAMFLLALLFYKKEKMMNFCERYLSLGFVLVWTTGFVVYNIGMYPEHETDTASAFLALLGVAPMAVVHAFEMFILQSDISAIHEECHNNGWYMFFFSMTHLAAAFISLVFAIKHFGFNIVLSIIRYWKTHVCIKESKDLFVFWGMNDATYCLAKDIIMNGTGKDGTIVIVKVNNEKEEKNGPLGMDRLFSFLSLNKRDMEHLQELMKKGCLTISTFGSLTNSPQSSEKNGLLGELKLESITKLMAHTTDTVHMLFLNDDEAFNIQALANLKNDKEIIACASQRKFIFYCHARHNSIHKVIEDEQSHENILVRVVDSSYISVEMMKQNVNLHPVNFVKVNEDATVSTPFRSLVVGFSEVGMDVVRFLYEYGAFVKAHKDGQKVERSEFVCHVVDKNMKELAGLFNVNTPSIEVSHDAKEESDLKKINFYNMDCRSMDFYNKLKTWIASLNFVVVATENDEMNISMAVRIMRMAIRYRTDMERMAILVRVRHDEDKHIQKIADHYNRLWAAEMNSTDKNKLKQRTIASNQELSSPICLIGSQEEVYTFNQIVSDEITKKAKKYKRKYDLSLNYIRQSSGLDPYRLESWDEERNNIMQLTGDNKGFSPTFSGMMRLRRVQSQNISNSMHEHTLVRLARLALGDIQYDEMKKHGLVRKDGDSSYEWADHANLHIGAYQRVLDVLAQTEHLRWVASHEILGYVNYGTESDKDEARLLHGCLKDWDDLSHSMQSYDYNVVDVALDLVDIDEDGQL